MPYRIKLTDEDRLQAAEEFAQALSNFKLPNGEISYTKKLGVVEGKATLYVTEKAYYKQKLLVDENTAEVGWHGVCVRGEAPATYIVKDIMVYPQVVGPATVTPDQVKYQDWLFSHDDDTFNNIRFQGHSHVNMATNPSGTDENFYESILQGLDDTMFYVFMILNKSGSRWIKIYDMRDNLVYETKDIDYFILKDENIGIYDFLADAREKVEKAAASTTPATGAYKGYKSYSSYYGSQGYQGYQGYGGNTQQTAITPVTQQSKKNKKSSSSYWDEEDYGGYWNGSY